MSKFPNKPVSSRSSSKRGKFGPPAAINVLRFARSLWPKAEEECCRAMIEATFEAIGDVTPDEKRRGLLGEVLEKAYEDLKE